MAKDGGGTPQELVVQSWIMYAVGIVLYLFRVYARYGRLGPKWKAEDYIMIMAIGWYTAFVVTNIQLAQGGGGTLYLPDEFSTFTSEDIAARSQYSKVEFASEQCMVNTIWFLKVCMLIIYYRMTANLELQYWVIACSVYTAMGFVAVQLTLFLNCRPFSGYWTIPPPQEQCATYFNYEVVQAVFNISSDLAILLVIIPTLWRMKMSITEKIPIVVIFGLGFFLIICAIVSKVFTFRDIYDTSYQFWYLREASVGVYVSNLPYVWPFLRRIIQSLRSVATETRRDPATTLPSNTIMSQNPLTNNFTNRTQNLKVDVISGDDSHPGQNENEQVSMAR